MTVASQLEPLDNRAPLYGLRVQLETNWKCKCGSDIAIVGRASEPHAAELACVRCGEHRGWLSDATSTWISTVTIKFGAPTTPIILRKR